MKYLATFIFFLSCSFLSEAQLQKPVKLMTYNIKFDDKNDQVNNWNNRKENLIGLLKYHQPNIFGTQEGLFNQLEDIDNALSDYTYVGVAREDGKQEGEYSAIFYDSTLFMLKSSGNFWLSETPDKPSKGWDAANTRICTWAHFENGESGKSFYVFNAHFDHVGVEARKNSIKLITKKVNEIAANSAVIVMGDFNFTNDSEPYQLITKNLSDSYLISEKAPYGPEATFNAFRFSEMPKRRIDYIFVNDGVEVLSYATLSDSKEMHYPSDHFPVQAQIRLK
jgi:endonuclease/exonuclease/phosphatase family metal-dependent hydrolase